MRKSIPLNYDWNYSIGWEDNKTTVVNIPHTNIETPYNYFDESIYQFKSSYQKNIFIEKDSAKNIILKFYGVQAYCEVYIDSKKVGEHFGGYDAFEFDITNFITESKEYSVKVLVDSFENKEIPPFGNVVDFLTYGGIYREVELQYLPKNYLKDVFLYPSFDNDWKLNIKINQPELSNMDLEISVNNQEFSTRITENDFSANFAVKDIIPWDLENPTLYSVNITLRDNGDVIDEIVERIGFRTAEFKVDGFYLNGEKIKLRGLNRHQSFAYVGYAMPASMQIQDADILKYQLGCNIVRTSHYPQSKHFINRCDEIGLLVFTEIIGWQHVSSSEKWRNLIIDSTQNMILQYRNHPSIIIWGVRVNESQDDHLLYTKTNSLAHSLDATRKTGGVRFIEKSELLEDVYTYNDFSHTGDNSGLKKKKEVTSNMKKPYLVTEYNGHMFPTKSYDSEVNRTSHAMRHSNVLEAMYNNDEISGCIGWCMNDYNTHKDFGSGDRICYHGVLNMFRQKKLASAVYASQQDTIPVLELNTGMQIGDNPKGQIEKVVAFTNCDYVELYKNNQLVEKFFAEKGTMPHKPILIDDLVGNLIHENENFDKKLADGVKELLLAVNKYGMSNVPLKTKLKMAYLMMRYKITMQDGVDLYGKYIGNWGQESVSYKVAGYKNNKKVIEKTYQPFNKLEYSVSFSSTELVIGDTYDVLQVFIEANDQHGNILPYYFDQVSVDCDEGIEVYGPTSFPIIAGQGSFYIRNKKTPGTYNVKIAIKDFEYTQVITVKERT